MTARPAIALLPSSEKYEACGIFMFCRWSSIRYNERLNTLLKGEDIVKFIKSQRIRWLEEVERMEDNAMPKRMLKGRPRMRWLDDV
jgi:hypothetical protein